MLSFEELQLLHINVFCNCGMDTHHLRHGMHSKPAHSLMQQCATTRTPVYLYAVCGWCVCGCVSVFVLLVCFFPRFVACCCHCESWLGSLFVCVCVCLCACRVFSPHLCVEFLITFSACRPLAARALRLSSRPPPPAPPAPPTPPAPYSLSHSFTHSLVLWQAQHAGHVTADFVEEAAFERFLKELDVVARSCGPACFRGRRSALDM